MEPEEPLRAYMRKKIPAYMKNNRMADGAPLVVAGLKDDEKLLKKHKINPDKMVDEAQKLIKSYERKKLREHKPKYKH